MLLDEATSALDFDNERAVQVSSAIIYCLGNHDNPGESEHGPDGEDGGDGDHGGDPGPERRHHLRAGGRAGGGERLTPGAVGPAGALLGNVEGKQQSSMATLNTDTNYVDLWHLCCSYVLYVLAMMLHFNLIY